MIDPLYARQLIHPDNRITFRIRAPRACDVKIEFGKPEGPERGERVYDLAKGDDGVWSVTTDPVLPGFHYYNVVIDGFSCADPAAAAYFGWGFWCSGIEVPDPSFDAADAQTVPHGDVRCHWYHSSITGAVRRILVYTPPGYDADAVTRYPALYLQHGSGEGELSWLGQGKANFVLDSLIARNAARAMLIVMDNGYAPPPGVERSARDANRFSDVVIRELVPEIDRHFRTLPDRTHRAIAGLSMGAGQALDIGLGNTGVFASVGAFSGGGWEFDPARSYGGIFGDTDKANRLLDLLWIGCGRQDRGFPHVKNLHERLAGLGIRHVWFECEGSHDWGVWRRHLHEMARRLFVAGG